jgi:hypothetical protein
LRQLAISPGEVERHVADANVALTERQRLLDVLAAERDKVSAEREQVYALYLAKGLDKDDFAPRYRPLTERLKQIDEELPALQASKGNAASDASHVTVEATGGVVKDLRNRASNLIIIDNDPVEQRSCR